MKATLSNAVTPFSYTPWTGMCTPVSTEVLDGEQTGDTFDQCQRNKKERACARACVRVCMRMCVCVRVLNTISIVLNAQLNAQLNCEVLGKTNHAEGNPSFQSIQTRLHKKSWCRSTAGYEQVRVNDFVQCKRL